MKINKPAKIGLIVLGVLAGSFLVWIYHNINPSGQSFIPKCPFHTLTGLHCPGCGTQRALHDFLNFNIVEGFKHNFLIGLGLLVIIYKLYLYVKSKYKPNDNTNLLYHPKTPWIILILVVSFWLFRNIPYEPFCYLAP